MNNSSTDPLAIIGTPNTANVSLSDTPHNPLKRPISSWIFYLIVCVSIGFLIVLFNFVVQKNPARAPLPSYPSPTPKPTPSYLPPGKQTYNINQNTPDLLPKVLTLTLDPIDVNIGNMQSVDITITSPSPITSVLLTLYADDKQKQTMSLEQANGSWHGSWKVLYSVWYRYVLVIKATNSTGENKAYVAPRTVGPILKSDLE